MQILGSELLKISTLSGGTFRNLTHMTLADGKELVAYEATGAETEQLEGWMLRYLVTQSALPMPRVIHTYDTLLRRTGSRGELDQ